MRLTLLLTSLMATGCASQIFSPPARFMAHEGPSMAAPGATWLHVEGGGGGQVFGSAAGGGTVRVAHGVDDVEWSGEASFAGLSDDFASTASRVWGAMRGGARGVFSRDFEHAYWGAGLGGGAYAGGAFLSPDLSVGIGYKNPYVIPYLTVGALLSVPLAAEEVDTTVESDEPSSDTPLLTFGYRIQLGVDIPMDEWAMFSLAAHAVGLVDTEGVDEGWIGFGGAFKFRL